MCTSKGCIKITLTPEEIAEADRLGQLRLRSSGNTGRNPARSQDRDMDERLLHERLGNMAEIATARYMGTHWEAAINRFHEKPDVGRVDVRASTLDHACLIFRDNDTAQWPYFLLIGDGVSGEMHLRGGLFGWECQQLGELRDPHGKRPSYFVKQQRLRPLPEKPGFPYHD